MTLNKHFGLKSAVTMGQAMLKIADSYPIVFLTERDFYPAVLAYLADNYPPVSVEFKQGKGNIDFRIGGTNPTLLELAVQPRELSDPNNPSLVFPGHNTRTALQRSANNSELTKLKESAKAKRRILLLLDLTGKYDETSLKATYQKQTFPQKTVVDVVYISSAKSWKIQI